MDMHVYWNILTMHGPINVKSPNNTSKWQMEFNSAFQGLNEKYHDGYKDWPVQNINDVLNTGKANNRNDSTISQWPRCLRRRTAAACLLRLWVRIPPGSWIFFSCECLVLSGRSLYDELITLPEESYQLWCVVVCDL
jgi:hypothetical protein